MNPVRLRSPDKTNVLGLLLQGYLQNALQNPELFDRAAGLSGNVWIRAGQMWATLCFDGEGVEIVSGRTDEGRASVEGEMDVLLGVVTGKGLWGPLLRGKISIGGNPLFLLSMLPILTAASRGES